MAVNTFYKDKYDNDASFVASMAEYGLTPKEILVTLAIGNIAPSLPDPSVPADQSETNEQRRVRTKIFHPGLMLSFWNGIPYTTQDTFIKELNTKIARMATRAAATGTNTIDPASGIRLGRLGIDLSELKKAILSGNTQKLLELTKKLAKNKAFAGKVQELVAQYVPKEMALDFAMQYGGPALQEIVKKYDIFLDRLKDDPIGYAKQLGMNIGEGQIKDLQNKVKGLIAEKGKELIQENAEKYLGEKGGDLIKNFGLSGFAIPSIQEATALVSSATYELSPPEVEIAKRIYTNAYYIFKDLWSLKDNRAMFLDGVYKKLYLIGPSFRRMEKEVAPDLSGLSGKPNPLYTVSSDQAKDVSLANLKELGPLIVAYALAAALGEKEPFVFNKNMAYAVGRHVAKKVTAKKQRDQAAASQLRIEENVRALESMNAKNANVRNSDIDFEARKRKLELQEKKKKELELLKKQLERAEAGQQKAPDDEFGMQIKSGAFKPVAATEGSNVARMVVGIGLLGGIGALYYYKFKK
jgi:hypothetical protein